MQVRAYPSRLRQRCQMHAQRQTPTRNRPARSFHAQPVMVVFQAIQHPPQGHGRRQQQDQPRQAAQIDSRPTYHRPSAGDLVSIVAESRASRAGLKLQVEPNASPRASTVLCCGSWFCNLTGWALDMVDRRFRREVGHQLRQTPPRASVRTLAKPGFPEAGHWVIVPPIQHMHPTERRNEPAPPGLAPAHQSHLRHQP